PLDDKEPPGYGPPVKKLPEECDHPASRERERPEILLRGATGGSPARAPPARAGEPPVAPGRLPPPVARAPGSPALFGVIPSFVLVGPLAVVAALFPGALAASVRFFGPWSLALELPMREFTFIAVGLLVATLYAGYRFATRSADRLPDGTDPAVRLSLSGESVGLGTLLACGAVALLAGSGPAPVAVETHAGDAETAFGPRLADVRVFELPDAHHAMSGVTAAGDRLYVGAGKQSGFGSYGFVFCLDRDTGKL